MGTGDVYAQVALFEQSAPVRYGNDWGSEAVIDLKHDLYVCKAFLAEAQCRTAHVQCIGGRCFVLC